jgi:hypothetical protein
VNSMPLNRRFAVMRRHSMEQVERVGGVIHEVDFAFQSP